MAKWSGYATQSEAWRKGYDWARSPVCDLPIDEAIDAAGYDFDTPEEAEFMMGAEFAQREQGPEVFSYDDE